MIATATAVVVSVSAGCTAAPGGQPSPAGPLEKVTVLTAFNITGQDSYLYVAAEKGFFADVGLQVRVEPGKGTVANLTLLAGGAAQFAVVDMTGALLEHAKPGPHEFRVFAAIYQQSVSCIMALASKGITTPKDLEGKFVGYSAGGVNFTLFPTYARLAGVDPAKVRWVQLAPPSLRPALVAGQLDAIIEIVIGRAAVEAVADTKVSVLPYSDVLRDLYGNVMATSLATTMGNPNLVRRCRQAMIRGLEYAIAHPEEAGQILARHVPTYKLDSAIAEVKATVPYIRSGPPIGTIAEARVMQTIALLQGAGALPAGLQPQQVIAPELTVAAGGG